MDEHRKNILTRLRRIEGQIQGLQRMVQQEAPCINILTQLSAVTAAMKKAGVTIIQANMGRCIQETSAGKAKALDDFENALKRFISAS